MYNDKPKPIPFEDISDDELCQYCSRTNYGERKFIDSPDGPIYCEGRWCEEAYDAYLEDFYNAKHTDDEEFFGQHMDRIFFYQKYGISQELASEIFKLPDDKKNILKEFGTDGVIKYLNDIKNSSINIKNHSEESLSNSEFISPMEEFFNKYNIK